MLNRRSLFASIASLAGLSVAAKVAPPKADDTAALIAAKCERVTININRGVDADSFIRSRRQIQRAMMR